MLMDRIVGAFTFRRDVYAEVEKDTSFTTTAWIIVAVVSFLSLLGSTSGTLGNRLISAVIGTIMQLIGFAVAAFVISALGKALFKADVSFDELVRTLGLASVWRVIGLLGIVSIFSTTLACVLTPISLIATVLTIVAWLIAAKEALDLDWVPTIVVVIIGWIAIFIANLVTGFVLGLLGITAVGIGGLFG